MDLVLDLLLVGVASLAVVPLFAVMAGGLRGGPRGGAGARLCARARGGGDRDQDSGGAGCEDSVHTADIGRARPGLSDGCAPGRILACVRLNARRDGQAATRRASMRRSASPPPRRFRAPARRRAGPGRPFGVTAAAPGELQHPPEDLAHDLVAAAADRPQARVADGALDPDLAHVAGAAVDLQAGVHQLVARALGQELGHRDLAHGFLARDEPAQRVVGDAARGVGARGEVRESVADRLMAGQRAPERAALARELRRCAPTRGASRRLPRAPSPGAPTGSWP